MSLDNRIIEYLRLHPGKKAREIADALGEDKPAVNSWLYRLRGRSVEQVAGFRWNVLAEGSKERSVASMHRACSAVGQSASHAASTVSATNDTHWRVDLVADVCDE